MRKPDFCLCENKGADQLRSFCEADQRLCFRYMDSTIPLVLKSEISSLQPPYVAAQADLCETWSETPKTGFLHRGSVISYCGTSCMYYFLFIYQMRALRGRQAALLALQQDAERKLANARENRNEGMIVDTED